jgi:Rrf2 family protein
MLRLTKRSEYGLMALAFMAQSGQAYTSVREIVAKLRIPRRLLAEVLKDLSFSEIVEAVRGPGGGYRLTCPAEELSLARVVEVLEGAGTVAQCTDGSRCDLSPSCTIQEGINLVAQRVKSVLNDFTLAELSDCTTPRPQPVSLAQGLAV